MLTLQSSVAVDGNNASLTRGPLPGGGGRGVAVTVPIAARDNGGAPNVTASCPSVTVDLVAGTLTGTFPAGNTSCNVSAVDAQGNAVSQVFAVTVADTSAPEFGPLNNVSGTAGLGNGIAAVSWAPIMATDLLDGNVTAVCVPPSGSVFSLGKTVSSSLGLVHSLGFGGEKPGLEACQPEVSLHGHASDLRVAAGLRLEPRVR